MRKIKKQRRAEHVISLGKTSEGLGRGSTNTIFVIDAGNPAKGLGITGSHKHTNYQLNPFEVDLES